MEGTFQVAKQLLNNVDTICDFQESQLYKHMKFQEVENPYTEEMKKELLEGFRNAEEFEMCIRDSSYRWRPRKKVHVYVLCYLSLCI